MNVFFLHSDPVVAAKWHCVRHRNKMIVEYAQLLSTAHHVLDEGENTLIKGIYQRTHVNHPSAVWVRESTGNYDWVLKCAMALCDLFLTHNWIQHNTYSILRTLHTYPKNLPRELRSTPPVCAPDEFKALSGSLDVCSIYQRYMISKYQEWQQRDKPLSIEYFGESPDWLKGCSGFEVQLVF